MTQNMAMYDRVIRFIVAVAIAVPFVMGYITASWALWTFGIVASILVVTSIAGFCPLYALFGFSTKQPTLRAR